LKHTQKKVWNELVGSISVGLQHSSCHSTERSRGDQFSRTS